MHPQIFGTKIKDNISKWTKTHPKKEMRKKKFQQKTTVFTVFNSQPFFTCFFLHLRLRCNTWGIAFPQVGRQGEPGRADEDPQRAHREFQGVQWWWYGLIQKSGYTLEVWQRTPENIPSQMESSLITYNHHFSGISWVYMYGNELWCHHHMLVWYTRFVFVSFFLF